jgi:hypothetical protein
VDRVALGSLHCEEVDSVVPAVSPRATGGDKAMPNERAIAYDHLRRMAEHVGLNPREFIEAVQRYGPAVVVVWARYCDEQDRLEGMLGRDYAVEQRRTRFREYFASMAKDDAPPTEP